MRPRSIGFWSNFSVNKRVGETRAVVQNWHLAQLNVGKVLYPPDDLRMQGFMSRLDQLNALADNSPGFVWRLQSEQGNATDIIVTEDPFFLINMSVWQSVETLFDFVYHSFHSEVMAGRRQWFVRPEEAYQVLWWIPAGQVPTPTQALERLAQLRAAGSGPDAFTFQSRHPPPNNA